MPWLTPDSTPMRLVRYQVYIPDDDTLRAAFRGALLKLEKPHNWEKFGTATPEEIAEAWENANYLNFEMVLCT